MNNTGQTIREYREKAGFTQRALAAALHITDKAISKWERGICLPDLTLLPKLALLLDTEVERLVSSSIAPEEWVGLIDIWDCDFAQTVYDKPLAYYLLTHYLLLGMTRIHVLTTERNRKYLERGNYGLFGFRFDYSPPEGRSLMAVRHPWFLFGSDLTHQFQGAMLSQRITGVAPEHQEPVFWFVPAKESGAFLEDPRQTTRKAPVRTLGRGMVCFDMDDYDKTLDVAAFVKTYQRNAGLLIGSLEEIAYRRGTLDRAQLERLADSVPYGSVLKKIR